MGSRDETVSLGASAGRGPLCVIVTAPKGTSTVKLPEHGTLRIGRSAECDLVIDDDSVSRVHAVIHLEPTVAISDAGSRNGTVVLGQKLGEGQRWPLALQSVVQIGRAVLVLQRAPEAAPVSEASSDSQVIAESPAMRRLLESIPVLASSPLCILILGETGVGKDVLARAIHRGSPRADGPFVALNCAALTESILESELFGHTKGAFTGAAQAKPGLFEAADGGTLFLDEVAELSLTTQAKLLRVLESGEVLPVGAVRPKRIDVRFIAATNRDLRARVKSGRMREDLYFRLDGMTVRVPPLRERPEDLIPLATSFARQAAARFGRPAPRFEDDVVRAMRHYAWPGNIRELRSVVERAVALSVGQSSLRTEHLQLRFEDDGSVRPSLAPPPAPASSGGDDERARIVEALARTSGNQKEAARLLGMSLRTLVRRITQYGIGRPRKDARS